MADLRVVRVSSGGDRGRRTLAAAEARDDEAEPDQKRDTHELVADRGQGLGRRLLEEHDPLETIESTDSNCKSESPHAQLEQRQTLTAIEKEIEKLPPRQREAFLMRYWEEMDIAETAAAMGCSEGSVKTHCSRATHTLAAALAAKGITL